MISAKQTKSVHSLKSWLFTPGTKADRFGKAADVHADVLIIDLEDAVAPSAKEEARSSALHYLERLSSNHLSCALRINAPVTRVGLDDLQALLHSSAQPDYIILPKTESAGVIGLVSTLLREAGKSTEVIALIETAKAVAALGENKRRGHQTGRLALRRCGHVGRPRSRDGLGATSDDQIPYRSNRCDCRDRSFGFPVLRHRQCGGSAARDGCFGQSGLSRQVCDPSGTNRGHQRGIASNRV